MTERPAIYCLHSEDLGGSENFVLATAFDTLAAELRITRIKLNDALHAEANANARATDTADRFAGFVVGRQAEWIGLFSQTGAAKLCKAAGLRVTKRAGHLPTKGSLLTAFDRLGADKQSKAIADLFDQLLTEDFES